MINRRQRIFASALAAVSLHAGVALADVSYSVSIEGASQGLTETLKKVSSIDSAGRTYATTASLRRAAKRDVESFRSALQAAGFYAGEASFRIEREIAGGPAEVIFEIAPGPEYKISNYEIIYEDEAEGRPAGFSETGRTPNGSAAGADLRDAQLLFLSHLWENGFPAAEIVARRASADFETDEATAIFIFNSGPKARFGEPKISGLKKTDPDYIRKLKTWEVGADFERSKMVAYRDALAASGLFSSVSVAPGAPDEDGAAPVLVELEERKRRTIGAGVSYSTSEGPGARVFLENRNMFRHGENLRIELKGSEIEQSIDFAFIRPFPELPGDIFGNFELRNETTDAFDARSIEMSAGLAKRWLNGRLQSRAALALETSKVKENGSEERTYLASAPLAVIWDNENNALNPTEGVRAAWAVTPYTGTDSFTVSEVTARSRVTFGAKDNFTLAGRVGLGATFGSSFSDLALNKRFYAGGGGSVRGFGFQEAGPLADDGDPIGGRSLIEAAVEARAKVTQNIQIAGFVDTGGVSDRPLPNINEDIFIGVGGGVRYITPIGPIRADVAFPLDKRDVDRGWQLYIAIGQPF